MKKDLLYLILIFNMNESTIGNFCPMATPIQATFNRYICKPKFDPGQLHVIIKETGPKRAGVGSNIQDRMHGNIQGLEYKHAASFKPFHFKVD